jgi:hypothetical protein
MFKLLKLFFRKELKEYLKVAPISRDRVLRAASLV